jgi:predicted molibdopterin-dependent oxidoreductase YjgC
MHWPCPDSGHPGTPTLHVDGPLNGRVQFQSVHYRPSDELPDVEFPLVLSTGRVLYHYNAATQTRRDPGTDAKSPNNFIEVHRYDARRLDVPASPGRLHVDAHALRRIPRESADQ